jgi:hypothetical protein
MDSNSRRFWTAFEMIAESLEVRGSGGTNRIPFLDRNGILGRIESGLFTDDKKDLARRGTFGPESVS